MTETKKKEFFNKKSRFEYEIKDTYEVGVVLLGLEIKAIRAGRVDLSTSYVKIKNGELFWIGGNLNLDEGDRQRTRKLLAHKTEIAKLSGKIQEKGLTLIPLKLYFKKGRVKLEIGLGKGKKEHDKRDVMKRRDQEREIQQKIKNHLSR